MYEMLERKNELKTKETGDDFRYVTKLLTCIHGNLGDFSIHPMFLLHESNRRIYDILVSTIFPINHHVATSPFTAHTSPPSDNRLENYLNESTQASIPL